MNLKTLSLLLAFPLVACADPKTDDDTAAPDDDDSGGNSEDWRTGAYADIELTYETTGGEVTTWSFRLEDGDPNSGSRYEDIVTVTPDDDDSDDDGHYFLARHRGCPEDDTDPDPPDDRPVTIELTGWSGHDYTSTFDLDVVREGCNTDSASIECAAGPGPAGEDSYFVLSVDDESGSLWSGTLSSYALCFQVQSGEDPLVGHAQVDVAFEARMEEP
ncbi:MAG: hypothetical protein L6Q80_10225 [Dehalococcoidia bacterium]|nr:hypothetical protein [Dehalococcoidia bacterium]